MKETPNDAIVSALRELSRTIQCDDGVANACCEEAANRIEDLVEACDLALDELYAWEILGPTRRKLQQVLSKGAK